MADARRVRCTVCKRHAADVGPISWRGKCGDCGRRLAVEAWDQLVAHRGPVFDHWRRRSLAALMIELDDDRPAA